MFQGAGVLGSPSFVSISRSPRSEGWSGPLGDCDPLPEGNKFKNKMYLPVAGARELLVIGVEKRSPAHLPRLTYPAKQIPSPRFALIYSSHTQLKAPLIG